MKLFTFFGDRETDQLISQISVMNCRSINKHSGQNITSSTGDDYYISIGNGDESTGRLFIKRNDLSIIVDNKVNCGEFEKHIISGGTIYYLKKERDPLDNRLMILFKGIEKIESSFLGNKNDYIIVIYPNEKIKIENLFGEEFSIKNTLSRKDTEIDIINCGSDFTIRN